MVKLSKVGQYKIQQMAFMILAIFFFFALVGLFFIGWQFSNLKGDFAHLQEEKALSALRVISDSPELNCDSSRDWCIDRDKLLAFSENSHLYDGYWSVASVELLIVYPSRSGDDYSFALEGSEEGESVDNDCFADHDGDGSFDKLLREEKRELFLEPSSGRLDHQSRHNEGSARAPLLAFDDLTPGEKVVIHDLEGEISYGSSESDAVASCDKSSSEGGYGGAVGGFYTKDNQKIFERSLLDFSSESGVLVPENAQKLYFYVIESDDFRFDYMDNEGGCSFSLTRKVYEPCSVENENKEGNEATNTVGLGNESYEPGEPVLCPGKGCDYYVLYDSGQEEKQTYSAYVNVCRKIDRSHEICELAKFMLGVDIPSKD